MWWASGAKLGSPGRLASSERWARLGGGLRGGGLALGRLALLAGGGHLRFRGFDGGGPASCLADDGGRQPPLKLLSAARRAAGPTICLTMADFERPPRVLVVEDDDAIAQVLMRSLRMEGYEVRVAEDGTVALDQAHGFLPDLVVLDLGLPGMDGLEVAKELRRQSDDVPILVLTARDAVESRVEGLDAGRRRLPGQAVRTSGAAGPAARAAAPPPTARPGQPGRR